MMRIIKKLSSLGERQLKQEKRAFEFIKQELDKNSIPYLTQKFTTYIPKVVSCKLIADNKTVPAESTSFVSGNIKNKYSILSSLISSQKNLYDANINFNPRSSYVSRSNHYFAPSLAISKNDIGKILKAKNIFGTVKVKKTKHNSKNILVGNIKNPKTIIFCHYDSIHNGACDNASGVAVMMDIANNYRGSLKNSLYVFGGNEELSYDKPVYWGHGYREFEKKYARQLKLAGRILVIDSVGIGKTAVFQDAHMVKLAFPLTNISDYAKKIKIISGNFDALMKVYHSKGDVPSNIKKGELIAAKNKILEYLK